MELTPALVDRVLACLTPNEHATTVRRLNKDYYKRYIDSVVVHLRRYVPPHALEEAWCAAPSIMHRSIATAVAASGDRPNMCWVADQGLSWDATACRSAAAEGHAELLEWLVRQGAPLDASVSAAAAREGRLPLLQLLAAAACPVNKFAAYAAAERGHLHVLSWLLEEAGAPADSRICELAALNGEQRAGAGASARRRSRPAAPPPGAAAGACTHARAPMSPRSPACGARADEGMARRWRSHESDGRRRRRPPAPRPPSAQATCRC